MNNKPWIRRTHERPTNYKQRGIRFHYGADGKVSHITTMSPKPSTIEREALEKATKKGE